MNGFPTASTTSSVTTSDLWQVGVGVSALFYVSRHDALRTYVSPRYAYSRGSTTNVSTGLGSGGLASTDTTGHFVAGSFGAQYALGRRFSVFGEVGLGYSWSENTPTTISSSFVSAATSRTLSTRSGAGVVLYF